MSRRSWVQSLVWSLFCTLTISCGIIQWLVGIFAFLHLSGSVLISNISIVIPCVSTHLHTLHHLPFFVLYLPSFISNFTVTLSDIIVRRLSVKFFLMSFCKVSTILMVIKTVLNVGEYFSQICGLC